MGFCKSEPLPHTKENLVKTNKHIMLTGSSYRAIASKEMPLRKMPVISSKGKVTHVEMGKLIPGMSTISTACLKAASREYHISPDIKDYNFALIPALVSDIPNVNMQAVPAKELLAFLPEHGCQSYRTYVGKCLFMEHDNQDPRKSLGIILDASIVPVKKYGISRVLVLAAYDRSKSAQAARLCLRNDTCYSMGCLCTSLTCSVCGGIQGPAVPRTCTCYDTNITDLLSFGKVKNGVLHYMKAKAPVFFEQSIVSIPAEFSCYNGESL